MMVYPILLIILLVMLFISEMVNKRHIQNCESALEKVSINFQHNI